ncbi:MAG: hypothetical protein E6Q93_17580 [Burkholderiaceae bacterium]|nr:MAG: hypothetical protein E6Q93_17580 [Burkholderiaceae bacterium]
MLRRFVEHYGGRAGVLPDPAAPEGRAALAASCHALRGACATIGAGALAAALHDLEAAASAPSADLAALAAAAARIRTDLDSLLRGLANALGR